MEFAPLEARGANSSLKEKTQIWKNFAIEGSKQEVTKLFPLDKMVEEQETLLYSERPKLYTILAILGAMGLRWNTHSL